MALAIWSVAHFTPFATATTAAAVRSPETAHTYADNTMLWHQLRWLPGSQTLVATVTFSNIDYISRDEPRHDETFDFPLPGVKFDSKTGTFFLSGAHGKAIPVAALRNELIVKGIELLPGAQIDISHRSDRVTLHLVASKTPLSGDRWVER